MKPNKIKLLKPSRCAHDEYELLNYPRKWFVAKPELPVGTELSVISTFANFYGSYYRCAMPEGMEDKYSIGYYDIPASKAMEL